MKLIVDPAHLPSERLGFYSFEASVPILVLVFYTYIIETDERRILEVVGQGLFVDFSISGHCYFSKISIVFFLPGLKSVLVGTRATVMTMRRVVIRAGG